MPNDTDPSLPDLAPDEHFCFDCNPQVPCFNRCCAELTLPLTPYDVLRLRRHLSLDSKTFLTSYTTMQTMPETGFTLCTLTMNKEPGEPCPFVSPVGCMVYEDRPSACRSYPLGRGTRLGAQGVIERFFLIKEDHCHGFDEGPERTPISWFEDQGLSPYNASNDRYMRLMSLVSAGKKPLDERMQSMARLALYYGDEFRQMITKMRIFKRLSLSQERQERILRDDMDGDAACLDFAYDWMELIIFGACDTLTRA
ncbi:MAG: YkgJ family cysteine cluster protein [Desulfovibrionaceae bacterium]|nr:YkgJ family cysteine cluster protein [Desulfovibrionaceae bacterium]